ncbi:hypothetical protein DFA_09913 [Cavenderia fasciculata]|uniref:Uncharacterized protein n=1 Tax=Cavenderia fasciculata TaxID=261658 RepID=F4Q8S0_CACFS|nr:uncharacterized protein DFA_09913 [Cavenderia fasciculata]EGG15089.1 hypothetical protein DFA_09913 [Cavenderia fasciculata]|eukprot:XP_004351809.1 hypothetical protein DFA_09913 [Cavenderia fasciculata]
MEDNTTTTTTTQGTLDGWLGIKKKDEQVDEASSDSKTTKKVKRPVKKQSKDEEVEEEEEEEEIKQDDDTTDTNESDDEKIKRYLTFDLKSIGTSKEYFGQVMEPLAKLLMNKTVIVAGTKEYRISEMEYYINGHAHKDTFTHGDVQQLEHSMWYFHRQNGGNYKSASYKGLDITFGDPECYCGILIRGIEEVTKAGKPAGTLVDGPSLTVDQLLASAGYATIDDLVKANGRSLLPSQNKVLHLRPTNNLVAAPTIITTGRVGLTMKMNRAGGHLYFAREYRFVRLPDKIKKGKQYMTAALHRQGKSDNEIRAITGSTLKAIKGLADAFDKGTKLAKSNISQYKDISKGEDCCILLGLCSNLDKLEDGSSTDQGVDNDGEEEEDEDQQEETDD